VTKARFPLHYFATAGEKIIGKEITFLHSFASEEICSASQLFSDLLTDRAKEQRMKFFVSGGEIRGWKTGLTLFVIFLYAQD
jgi:hypothetical protein